MSTHIEKLKKDCLSADADVRWAAMLELSQTGGADAYRYFVEMLRIGSARAMHIAANGLREMQANNAVDTLIDIILDGDNIYTSGSLVYALAGLDCSRHLSDIFRIFYYAPWESKHHAYLILTQQQFDITDEDRKDIAGMWADITAHNAKSPDFGIAKSMMTTVTEQYLN